MAQRGTEKESVGTRRSRTSDSAHSAPVPQHLRAPLNAIASSSYRLLEGGMGELNATQMQCVKNILDQANQLRAQLKELQHRMTWI